MSTATMERPAVHASAIGAPIRSALGETVRALAARRAERRELRSWLGRNHPTVGRDTGCRV